MLKRTLCLYLSISCPTNALQLWRTEGVAGFYRGCSANLLRTTPAAALTFTSFELIVRELRKYAAEQHASTAAV